MSFISLMGNLVPRHVRDKFKVRLAYSTLKSTPSSFIGWAMMLGIIVGFIVAVVGASREWMGPLPLFLAAFAAFQVLVWVWLELNISSKARQVEEVLPDALQLMSSNVRAGLTTDKALILAARPEFGALEEEIRRVGKETMAGRNLVDALDRMRYHIRSTNLERTIELMVHSLKSGGQLADLLDQTADDLRDQQIVQKEISASVLMYVLFIFIAIALGAPVLFAMSSFLVELLTTNMSMIAKEMPQDFDGMGAAPISMTSVDPGFSDFIRQYSYISMVVSCIFGSMIIGLILKGEESEGLKYVPVLLAIALALFYIASTLLSTFMGGMLPS